MWYEQVGFVIGAPLARILKSGAKKYFQYVCIHPSIHLSICACGRVLTCACAHVGVLVCVILKFLVFQVEKVALSRKGRYPVGFVHFSDRSVSFHSVITMSDFLQQTKFQCFYSFTHALNQQKRSMCKHCLGSSSCILWSL